MNHLLQHHTSTSHNHTAHMQMPMFLLGGKTALPRFLKFIPWKTKAIRTYPLSTGPATPAVLGPVTERAQQRATDKMKGLEQLFSDEKLRELELLSSREGKAWKVWRISSMYLNQGKVQIGGSHHSLPCCFHP